MKHLWELFKKGAKGTATSIPALILAIAGGVVVASQNGVEVPHPIVGIAMGISVVAGAMGLNNAVPVHVNPVITEKK